MVCLGSKLEGIHETTSLQTRQIQGGPRLALRKVGEFGSSGLSLGLSQNICTAGICIGDILEPQASIAAWSAGNAGQRLGHLAYVRPQVPDPVPQKGKRKLKEVLSGQEALVFDQQINDVCGSKMMWAGLFRAHH